ncbi:MAG: flagellar biosynthesis anti-sigma factor FlgM, partial [Luminiphilus sp.]
RGGESESSKGSASKSADSVQLTDTANRLAELQAEVAQADGVDLERVEAIRQQIADGSYEVDADRVADALMTMEKELL